MNIKALAAAAVLSTAAIFAPAPAEAMTCFDFEGGTLCNVNYGPSPYGGREYYVGWSDGARVESMEVHCNGRNLLYWESTGPLTEGQARYLATEFCALPNG